MNRCGFHIVEFFNAHQPDSNDPDVLNDTTDAQFTDGMFKFEKAIR